MKKIFSILLVLTMLLSALIIPVSADEAQVPEVLGASIRTGGEQGLRFIGRIKKDGDITLTFGEEANFGFIIIPESSTDGSAIDKDTQYAKTVKAVNLLGSGIVEAAGLTYDDDYYYFSVVQKGIPANFYTTQLVVKAYVDNGGTYIYSNNPTKEKRSIQYVAQELVNGGDENPAYAAILTTAAAEGSDIYVNADRFSVLEIYPAYPDCIARDNLYTVSVSQGLTTEPLLVYNQTASYSHITPTDTTSRALAAMDSNRRFCEFAFAYDSVTVNIKVNKNFNSYVVSPTSKGFASTYNNGVISVTLEKPEQFVVILDDDYNTALSVFADTPEYDVPQKGASNVVYVEGDSVITLPESQPELVTYAGPNNEIMVIKGHKTKVYIAPGAVLKKGIFCSRTEDGGYAAKIYGRGAVLDPYSDYTTSDATVAVSLTDYDGTENKSYSALKAVINCYQFSCELKDIKVLDARRFNILFAQSGCSADNVKILSTEMSTDGFMTSQNVTVKNCFVYNGDNSLVMGGGSKTDGGEYNNTFENITIGTTCAAVYPQYSFIGSLKDIYVFRADDNLINVHEDNSGAMEMTIDGLDALDCVKVPLIFGDNGGNGSAEKVFNIKNLVTRYTTGSSGSFTPGTYSNQYNSMECGSSGYIFNFTNLCVGGHRIGPDNDGSSIKVGSAYHGANTTGGNTTSGMTLNFAYDSTDMPAHTSVPANKTAEYTGGADYVAGPIRGWTEAKSYDCNVKWNGGTSYTVSETDDTGKWGFSLDLTEIMRTYGAGTYSVTIDLSKAMTMYLIKCGNTTNAFTKTTYGGKASRTISVTVTAEDIRDNTYHILIYAGSASVNTFTMNSFSISVPNS